jgi:hypothetical protein
LFGDFGALRARALHVEAIVALAFRRSMICSEKS